MPPFKSVNDPKWNEACEAMQKELDEIERKRIESAKRALRYAYWRNFDKLPSVWVARDEDGTLWIYQGKPVKACGMFHCGSIGDMFQIDGSAYPEITFDNSPVKVKLMFIDA